MSLHSIMERKAKLAIEALTLIVVAYALVHIFPIDDKPAPSGDTEQTTQASTIEIYDPSKAFEGNTLIPIEGTAEVLLVDVRGNIIHKWNLDAVRARLLPDKNLLVVHGTKWGLTVPKWERLRRWVIEYDWNGKEVWKYEAADVAHHDLQRLVNGNTLVLRREIVPAEFKSKIHDAMLRKQPIRSDTIHEVTPTGEIVWTWRAHEVLDLNSCGAKPCREFQGNMDALKKMKDWTHVNTVSVIPENKWFDQGDKRFRPGNIVVLPRNWWTVFIIDKQTGQVVWEYSGDYKGGISGGHEAHMIEKGYEGAGNILVFDNGRKRHEGESFILEVNPTNKKLEWIYEAGKTFYSSARGSVQRLKNGNTLISEDKTGRCFEVTRDKEVVWQYQSVREINRCRRY